jgi:hypothetical protein
MIGAGLNNWMKIRFLTSDNEVKMTEIKRQTDHEHKRRKEKNNVTLKQSNNDKRRRT